MLFKDLSIKGKNAYIDQHVTKLGYINLFPFFTGMLLEEDYEEKYRVKV